MSVFLSNTLTSPLGNYSFKKPLVSKYVDFNKFAYRICGKSAYVKPSFLNPESFHCFSSTSSSSSVLEDKTNSTIVFVKGLPQATSEGSLQRVFSEFGEVDRVKIITDKKSKQPLGFAYIWFTSNESAQMAVKEMNGKFFDGRFVTVTIARPESCKTRVNKIPFKF